MAAQIPQSTQNAVPYSRPHSPDVHTVSQIGFVGLGSMGYPMARNLADHRASHLKSYPPILIWNRSSEKAQKLLDASGPDKVRVARDLAQVALECDVIITNLANDDVVKAVYDQFAAALKNSPPTRNKIFVETSTTYPSLAEELDGLLAAFAHARLITCPVFGVPAIADKAQLLLVMSGDYRSKKEVAYLFVPAIGRKVIDLGGNPKKAPTFKLIGNSMILGSLEILAEAHTIAEKAGIPAADVHHFVQEFFPAPGVIRYSEKIMRDEFDGSVGFTIDGGVKDASHIRRLAAEVNSPMPVIDIAHQHLLTARAIHDSQKQAGTARFEPLDWSSIVAGPRVAAGLDGLDSQKHSSVVRKE